MSQTNPAATNTVDRLRAFLNADGGNTKPEATAAPDAEETATPTPANRVLDDIDAEAGFEDEGPINIPASELSDFWEEGWHFVEIVGAKRGVAKSSGKKQITVDYRGLAGVMSGSYKTDYWSLEGAGLKKTGRAAAAVDQRDPKTGALVIPSMDVLIGKRLWIFIEHKIEPYTNAKGDTIESVKDSVKFPDGYAHASKYEVPKAGDLFAEAGAPTPAAG